MTGSLKLISIEILAQRAIQQGLHLT